MSPELFHLVTDEEWADALARGTLRPASLQTEGFVHCSFGDQVAGSANRHYPRAPGLLAVELDPARVAAELRVEDSYRRGTAYPHLYGEIPLGAAVAVHRLHRDRTGQWTFSGGSSAAASPDR